MARKFLLSIAALIALTAAGCQQHEEQVIETLPGPSRAPRYTRTQSQPRYSDRPQQPRKNYSLWWPNPNAQQPKWQALPLAPVSPEAGWLPPGGIKSRWTHIVVHHSGSDLDSPASMTRYHNSKGWDGLGYHFVIANGRGNGDGYIHVGERWREQRTGAHCKTPGAYYNEHGIGICLAGNLDSHRPTDRQMQSLARLVAFLQRQCNIPSDNVTTHGRVTRKTRCPGRNFNRNELLIRVNAYR